MKYCIRYYLLFFLSAPIVFSDEITTSQAFANGGMVVTQHYLATQIGKDVLDQGGNAFDAAVAVGFAMAVVLPRAGNIGGGGFMVMYDAVSGDSSSIDYREKAPLLSSRDMYLDQNNEFDSLKSTVGYLSVGVPGTVYGLWEVHQKYGSLPWSDLLQPSIVLAERGFEMSNYMIKTLKRYKPKLSYFAESNKIFFEGTQELSSKILVQTDLSKTLKRIQKFGVKDFYEGETANMIALEMTKNGGLISLDDLKKYRPIWREPLKGVYRGKEIITMGPPSSGGLHLIQMLNILENFDLNMYEHNSTDYIALLSEIMKYAYADRSKYLGDPDFFDVPTFEIVNKSYAKRIYQEILKNPQKSAEQILPGQLLFDESNETTHFSIADQFGNVISNTYTLNSAYGSGVTIRGTGILMNNEMDDFSGAPGVPNQFNLIGGIANEIVPEKRPLSSMTPTLIFDNGNPLMAVGSPGGSRIITTVLQMIINVIDFSMDIDEATSASRIHHQWYPDRIDIEKSNINTESLIDMGYEINLIDPATCTQSIYFENNMFIGSGDLRRPDSLALGVSK